MAVWSAATRPSSLYCPTPAKNKVSSEGGIFVQDKWTMDRVTISVGLRFDWFNSENPEYHLGPSHPDAEPELRRAGLRYDPLQGLDAQGRGGVGRVRRRQDARSRSTTASTCSVRRWSSAVSPASRATTCSSRRRDVDRQRPRLRSRLRSDRNPRPRVRRRPASTTGGHVQRRRRQRTPTSTTTRCARTSPCRTMRATGGASGRTAGSSR